MFNIRKKIIFSLISSLMIFALLACSSTELPDIDATVEARLAIIPTPTPQVIEVVKEVIKEVEVKVPVEKIV
ncbi:MAG: hypothetical protein MK201_06630, partial [Gammaproteobacteria bacterium]|nr:hypothetical protein [Gammaproteobacteria bacterium]